MKGAIITGASSGIGMELARVLTKRGYSVALLARRAELLEALAAELPGSAAIPCDVADAAAVTAAVRQAEVKLGGPIDLAVANAGIGVLSHATKFDPATAELMVRVNILGTMFLFGAVIPSMIARRTGTFAGVASVAGLRGLPTSAVYSATKSAMHSFLEASRVELIPHGVRVVTVNPGFVATPMTAKNRFAMPFLMQAPQAAKRIADGLEWGSRVIEFPRAMSLLMRTARLIPDALYDRLAGRMSR
jgi:short-subunit dehydrogenase